MAKPSSDPSQSREFATAVVRRLRVVRIGKRAEGQTDVELGCLFDAPLVDAETAALGIVLPKPGESWDHVERRAKEAPTPPA